MTAWIRTFCLLAMVLQSVESPGADVLIPVDRINNYKNQKLYVLAIGVGRYQDKFWPTLKFPGKDASRLAKSIKPGDGKIELVTLTDSEATLSRIRKELKKIQKESRPRDIVVIYISSHGSLMQLGSGELGQVAIVHDTKKTQIEESSLSHRELRQWLSAIKANRKLLMLATCHSGVGKSRLSPEIQRLIAEQKGKIVPLDEVSEGALILAASAQGEPAREDAKLGGDIYTHFFVEGLGTYDRNRDGVVSALEAHDYARDKTYAWSRGRQRPTADARLVGDADIPLRGRKTKSGLPVLEAYEESYEGFQVSVDDGVKGVLPSAFPLTGSYNTVHVYNPAGEKLASYRVSADAGDTIELEELFRPPPFSVGAGIALRANSKETTESVAAGTTRFTELQVGYHYKTFYLGGRYGFTPEIEGDGLRSGLSTRYSSQSAGLAGSWQVYDRHPFSLGLQIQVRQVVANLEIIDDVTDLSLAKKSTSLGYAWGVSTCWQISTSGCLSADWQQWRESHDFDEWGTIDTSGAEFGLGFRYFLGGAARRL